MNVAPLSLRLLFTWCVMLVAVGVLAQTPAPEIRINSAPPAGFEDLAAPQVTQVDVFFAGRLLVSTLARYDLTHITFLAPQEIADAIPQIIDSEVVADALSAALPTHAAMRCAHTAQTDCGTLAPGVAGVIFDEDSFRADLFVNPLQLQAHRVFTSKVLPPSSARKFSTMHLLDMSASGGGEGAGAFDLGATSLLAWGESRVHSRYNLTSDGVSLNELAWQHDRGLYRYETGLFRSAGRGFTFVGEQDVLGARWGSSLDTRVDLDSAEGTPIFLFLNQHSRVDIFRGEQLADSRFYAGGSQQLDTTRLPDGAYDIVVNIQGDDGRQSQERYFFVRTRQLPPLDQPLYFAEAGRLVDTGRASNPALAGNTWARVGTARRLRDYAGVEAELVHVGGRSLVQAGAFVFGPGWQMRASLMRGSDGATGSWINASWHRDTLALGLDLRRVQASRYNAMQPDTLFEQSYTQGTVTMTAPVLSGRLAVRAQMDRRGSANAVLGYGASFSRPLLHRGALFVDLDFDASIAQDDRLVRLGVQARWRRKGRNTTLRPGLEYHATAQESAVRARLDARTTTQRTSARFGQVFTTAYALSESDRTTLGAGLTSDSVRGRANVEAQYVDGQDAGYLAYSANASFTVAATGEQIAVGGRRNALAALIVDIPTPLPGASFDVIVDEQVAGTIHGGGRSVVNLQPYQRYQVRLAARGDTIVDIDERAHDITLYPGNVYTLHYAPKTLTVLVGQAMWPNGSPVANARFENVQGYGATDASGWFQVEVTSFEPLHLVDATRGVCTIELDDISVTQGLAVLPPLPCSPTVALP